MASIFLKNASRLLIALFLVTISFSKNGFSQAISPDLVGTNVWINPGTTQWNRVSEAGLKIMRIGGHAYDVTMPSDAQLMDWILKIKNMGAEPLLQVSQYGATRAANAARLVKLLNIDNPQYYVKYWGVGNEPWLQAGKPTDWGPVISNVEGYYKEIVPGMKAIDPAIKVFGPDECYYESRLYDALFGGSNDITGKIPGQDYYYCDGLVWHKYASGDLSHTVLEAFRGNIVSCKTRIDYANGINNRTGSDALIWGIGEFNSDSNGGPCTFDAGQMFAGIYMYAMQYEGKFATCWSMKEGEVECSTTDFGTIHWDGTPRSTLAHMQMVAKLTGNYAAGTSSYSEVLVFGSNNGSHIYAMLVNRSASSQNYTIRLDNGTVTAAQLTLKIDAGVASEYSSTIGGDESQLLIFSNTGVALQKWTYNSTMDRQWASRVILQVEEVPAAPGSLTATAISNKQVNIGWSDLSTNEEGFTIERKTGTGSFAVIGTRGVNATNFSDTGLSGSTQYTYRVKATNSGGSSEYSNEAIATTEANPPQLPYNGPHFIPGSLQAEDFDTEGEGIAYHDNDATNNGGQYRASEGVDIELTGAGTGYDVGWNVNGEWLEYTIETVNAGIYDIELTCASNNTVTTKSLNLILGGVTLGAFTPAYTGGWQNWQTITMNNVEIGGGSNQVLRVEIGGGSFNIDSIHFELIAPLTSNTVTNTVVGSGITRCFDATETITTAGNETTFIVEDGGIVDLIAGENIIMLPGTQVLSGGYLHAQITTVGDYCSVITPAPVAKSMTDMLPVQQISKAIEPGDKLNNEASFIVYPNPNPGRFTIELSGYDIQEQVEVTIYGIRGERIQQKNIFGNTHHLFSIEGQLPGVYFVQVRSNDKVGVKRLVKQ